LLSLSSTNIMANGARSPSREESAREKFRVAISSLLAAVLLTVLKLAVGLMTRSLGILAEAAHSGLDLLAAAVTLWAVHMSSREADRKQTYGYGKFENLSALFETLLLLVTCIWIVYEASRRLFFGEKIEVDPSVWAFLVVILSIVVDYSRSRALLRVSRKYHSQALEADALHFSTDIWSSCVVLFGLLGVRAANSFRLPWLSDADTLAAVAVAGIVVWVSLKLGKKSVDDLLDRIPDDLRDRVAHAAGQVRGVESVTKVRMRRSGSEVFADIVLSVGHSISFERAHEIADEAAEAVRTVVPDADVVVHAEPQVLSDLDITMQVRILAARHGLGAHAIRLYEENSQRWLELHLEVPESLTLDEAHRQATSFESDLRANVPEMTRIVSHLEPVGDSTAIIQAEPADAAEVLTAVEEYFHGDASVVHLHNLKVQRAGGQIQVSFHCRLDPQMRIEDAHELTIALEAHIRARVGNVGRVVIHVEPTKDANQP
jgi:cation diffusion facilitator family transporter